MIYLLDEPIPAKDDKTKKSEIPAQNKIILTLNVLSGSTASLTNLDKNLGLNTENKTQLESLMVSDGRKETKPTEIFKSTKALGKKEAHY